MRVKIALIPSLKDRITAALLFSVNRRGQNSLSPDTVAQSQVPRVKEDG